jgi:hypothetical protein
MQSKEKCIKITKGQSFSERIAGLFLMLHSLGGATLFLLHMEQVSNDRLRSDHILPWGEWRRRRESQ